MGMRIAEWHGMLFKDMFMALRYFSKEKEREREATAELIRLQTFELLNINLPRNKKLKDPSELWKFAWEEKGEQQEARMDTERLKAVQKIWQKEI